MSFTLPIPSSSLSYASVATSAWRAGGQLHVTAVVKATFALVPEGRMTLLAPEPIVHEEVPEPSGVGLRAAGDLAPHLRQTDVLLSGHAEVPPRFSAPELRIGLGVVRDGAMKVDRSLELDATARVGPARAHVHIHGAGPMSREWPKRSQLLGAIDPSCLQGPILDIPAQLDWGYFQVAPAEQRMDLLRGDEWLVLGGIFAGRPRLRTQLPEARAVACVYRKHAAAPRRGEPIRLVADTLQIDSDRRCVAILWRGNTRIHEAELGSLHVVAGLEMPGRPVVWADPFPPDVAGQPAAAPVSSKLAPPPPSAPEENPLDGTYMLPDDMLLRLAAEPSTPFENRAEQKPAGHVPARIPPPETKTAERRPVKSGHVLPPPERNPLAGTFELPDDSALALPAAPATPFDAPVPVAAPAALVEASALAAAPATPVEASALAAAPATPVEAPVPAATPAALVEASALAAALVTPVEAPVPVATPAAFAGAANEPVAPAPLSPPELNPLSGTFQLPDDSALVLGEAPATPFAAPSASASRGPSILSLALSKLASARREPAPANQAEAPPAPEANPLSGTFMLSDDFSLNLAPVTPFEQLDKSERDALIQMKLGDVFLAAMESAGEPDRSRPRDAGASADR